jgi:hypothetical protein
MLEDFFLDFVALIIVECSMEKPSGISAWEQQCFWMQMFARC